jgi:hypothetical protein
MLWMYPTEFLCDISIIIRTAFGSRKRQYSPAELGQLCITEEYALWIDACCYQCRVLDPCLYRLAMVVCGDSGGPSRTAQSRPN